ncbi:flagellar protein FliS [Sphingomonas koreensis]|nr:flagellar protein FliS [Sphingomonas koreensis]TPG41452.1 flagellar protein FliS [Sphingomonas koreensis]
MMVRYATRLGRDPAATYRQIDVAGRTAEADPHRLVELLYEELVHALRTLAWATEHRQFAVRSEKATRATAILFALEAGLDFDQGGDVAKTLSRLYRGARQTVIEASVGRDPKPFLHVAATLEEIAEAWRSVRGS